MSAPTLPPPVAPAVPPAVVATPAPVDPDVPTLPIYRLSVAQYHAMIEHGILMDGDPVELLEGWLVTKMGKNRPHIAGTRRARLRLAAVIPRSWFVDSQNPITTGDSEPEPDVIVARGTEDDALDGRKPAPQDVGLAVEIADSSLARDQIVKQRLFARAGVPVYWIVNLVDRRVDVYTQPSGPADAPAYHQRQDFGPGDAVPVVLDGVEVGRLAVDDLLP